MTHINLAEHFDDPQQQKDAAGLGMWTFLATEVLFFGGMFTGYTVYRTIYPAAFAEASGDLYLWIASVNTAILLISSFTMAMAIHAASHSTSRRQVTFLCITIGLGLCFLAMKALEYGLDYSDQILPGFGFASTEFTHPAHSKLFFTFYFIMTGIHAVHVTVGIGVMVVLTVLAGRGRFNEDYDTPLEMTGLYWHFVDIVWIFLLPLLYLIK